jgi:muramidase (phage lysozyme)
MTLIGLLMAITVTLEGYPDFWTEGKEVLDCQVSLGQQQNSSSCTVVLADPGGKIAADLIEHTLKSGGIQALPGNKPPVASGAPTASGGGSSASLDTTPARKAFLDTIAYAEGADYNVMFTGKTFSGYSDHPRQLQGSGLRSDAAGRYQFLSTTWDGAKKALGLKDFSPASQDRAGLYLVDQRGALGDVDAGRIEAAITKCSYEWASFPPPRYPQPTKPMAELLAYYQKRLASYQGGAATQAPTKLDATEAQPIPEELFKGSKLLVNINGFEFEYYHQGTKYNHNEGKTTLVGQGIRWVLNRRKRSKTLANVSLKQLAQTVSKAHGVKLDWQTQLDPKYRHIDQSGLSDFQLLLRECEANGLFVSEVKGTLTIKSLKEVRDVQVTLAPGLNLLSVSIEDKAISASDGDSSSSQGQSEPKIDLDPVTGQLKPLVADIDPVKDTSVSGKAAKAPSGTLEPGSDAIAAQSKARYKRVKGLPSTFVLPMSAESLALQPLDAVRTLGLAGILSRIWLIDDVSHSYGDSTTTLKCYSPVEVLDLSPPSGSGAIAGFGAVGTGKPGSYVYPVKGFVVTSLRAWRTHPVYGTKRMHHGTDIGCPSGTPIVASATGRCTYSGYADGYGLVVYLKHDDSHETRYAHCDQLIARVGGTYQQGQRIALSGATGVGTGAHLHWEIRDGSGNSIDPKAVGLPVALGQSI